MSWKRLNDDLPADAPDYQTLSLHYKLDDQVFSWNDLRQQAELLLEGILAQNEAVCDLTIERNYC
jgi:hypothetical protein